MKILSGSELVGYIKERQAKQVRNLRQSHKIFPKLAIITTTDNPVITTYVNLKRRYGEDILIDTEVHEVTMEQISEAITKLNNNNDIHGIIVQLPLADETRTDEILRQIASEKDVDGLGGDEVFIPATALAIQWLLAGYNIELENKKLLIVGNGRLVGAPLARLWQRSGLAPTIADINTPDLAAETKLADIIVTATGVPGLIKSDMIKPETVLVDAGTASENGKLVGDLAPDIRERDDLTMTPEKGGVGPLTIAALFDNVIQAARQRIS